MLANSLIELDRAHWVHPVASWRGHEQAGVRVLASAKGATVTDASGRQLLDGFAGLWCVNAGYGHESIVEAAARQMRELPYATGYFGLGAEPSVRLAAPLAGDEVRDGAAARTNRRSATPRTPAAGPRRCGPAPTPPGPGRDRCCRSSSASACPGTVAPRRRSSRGGCRTGPGSSGRSVDRRPRADPAPRRTRSAGRSAGSRGRHCRRATWSNGDRWRPWGAIAPQDRGGSAAPSAGDWWTACPHWLPPTP